MAKKKISLQYAALPYVVREGVPLFMLITSRETRRWIIPKGWPIKNLLPHEVASREAFEEAGLLGQVAETPFASFKYTKRMPLNKRRRCTVDVFSLAVEQELDAWPEIGQREREWVSAEEAARRVAEAGLIAVFLHIGEVIGQGGDLRQALGHS